MRGLLGLLLVVVLGVLLVTRAEPLGPRATLDGVPAVVGAGTPIRASLRDRGSGLAHIEIRLVPGDGGEPLVLSAMDFLRTSFFGSGVHEATLDATLGDHAVAEGPATLEVWATDHSWFSALRRGPRVAQAVTVDRTPPMVAVLTTQHVVRLGGSESVIFRVSPDTVRSGVQVGDYWFPATPDRFTDPQLRVALFAVPHDAPQAIPQVVALDAAGNRRVASFDVTVKPRQFASKTLQITDDFLQRKIPELLSANGMDTSGTPVDGFLRVNRDLRKTTEARLREICRESAPEPLWEGAFLRLPDSAPLSGFADQRTYVHDGQTIDRQTHLGFDLASLKHAVVPAGNDGRVVFAGPLGIYGTTVVLDHGLGLFSLYGHLSELAVQVGQTVKKGDPLGRTGETGLAGGDHLHFSTMLDGIHVDAVEWWDAHWIRDHVLARLAAYPRTAGGASDAAPPAGGPAAAGTPPAAAPGGAPPTGATAPPTPPEPHA